MYIFFFEVHTHRHQILRAVFYEFFLEMVIIAFSLVFIYAMAGPDDVLLVIRTYVYWECCAEVKGDAVMHRSSSSGW